MKVFFSYSHCDEEFRDRLERHLSLLKRQRVIETWHDRRIEAGGHIDDGISEHLEAADIVLLLVSADFLASDYCYDREMTRAMERHEKVEARVIPVILRPCYWQGAPFGRLRAVPKDGKPVASFQDRDDAFLEITEAIRDVANTSARQPAQQAPSDHIASRTRIPVPRKQTNSGLKLKRTFTDCDRDRFLDEAFEHIASHFQSALGDLEQAHEEIETRFTRQSHTSLVGTIYVRGNVATECKVWVGTRGSLIGGLAFSNSPASESAFNENLSVVDDGTELRFKALMQAASGVPDTMTKEDAAEYYWEMLTRSLRR